MKELLRNSVLVKLLVLFAVTLVLMLPLAQIGWLVQERGHSQRQAAQELAAAHAGPQTLVGPVLVVPYVERWTEAELDGRGQVKSRTPQSMSGVQLVFPERSELQGQLAPQERYRGIFKVPFYELQGRVAGSFPAFDPGRVPRRQKDSSIELQPPVLALFLSDVRGLQGSPALALAGSPARFLPGVPGLRDDAWLRKGVHAPLPEAALRAFEERQALPFDLQLNVIGQERLAIAPIADETIARLRSDWPHPSFGGQFLAGQRNVGDSGFEARWAVSSLVSTARAQVRESLSSARFPEQLQVFSVSLAQPVNAYTLANRAVKYSALFVVLTLLAVFMVELLRKLRLHPVQYLLVGASIAIFFLLLLALSEKLAFPVAYLLAASASSLLLTVYFSAVLQGLRRGLSLGGYVAALYGTLYGLLSSEDNALLLGALLLFGLLAVLMLATRKLDWYTVSLRPA